MSQDQRRPSPWSRSVLHVQGVGARSALTRPMHRRTSLSHTGGTTYTFLTPPSLPIPPTPVKTATRCTRPAPTGPSATTAKPSMPNKPPPRSSANTLDHSGPPVSPTPEPQPSSPSTKPSSPSVRSPQSRSVSSPSSSQPSTEHSNVAAKSPASPLSAHHERPSVASTFYKPSQSA